MGKFADFDRKSARQTRDPQITLQKGGSISVNAAAAALLGITEPTPIVFVFDEEGQRVGMKVAPEDSENQYMLRGQPKSASFIVAGSAFCKFHGIDTDEARRFDAKLYGKSTLGFALTDESQPAGRGSAPDAE